jgi:CHAT domain-containing protein
LTRTVIDGSAERSPLCIAEDKLILSFDPLPETSGEVEEVARVLRADPAQAVVQKASFTDAAVKSRGDLRQYRIVYFATHGLLPRSSACWPHPVLATSFPTTGRSDPADDGMLDAVEISKLRMDADLVVLSACDTAGGGGEGGPGAGQVLGGLAQSFALAGSRGLLVSHWQVNSAATRDLMTTLFTTRAGGADTAESLIAAQAKVRDAPPATAPASGATAGGNRYPTSHPYYWAAFTLVMT